MTARILGLILRMAPAPFRARFGQEVMEVHRLRTREPRGPVRLLFFPVREIVGALFLVLRLHLGAREGGRWRKDRPSGGGPLEFLFQDLRFGIRVLRRRKVYSATVILVLALGIGAGTAIFSAVNAFFFRPLPFRNPDGLVRVYETNPEYGWDFADAAPANALDWREQVEGFNDVALYTPWVSQATFLRDGEPELLNHTLVTGNFFDVLGVSAALGRTFRWEETWDDGEQRIVLSHGLWASHFGSDSGVVGRSLEFTWGSARVVGVMPPGFAFPSSEVQFWTTWDWNREAREATWFRRAHWVHPIARLAEGTSVEEAGAQLQVVVRRLQEDYPETNRVMGAGLMPLRDFLIREVRRPLLILLGAVGLLLLLACTNVANLQLIRATDRAREVSLRFALGASRLRVARQVLAESLTLSLLGGVVGLWLGWVGVGMVERMNPMGIQGATGLALDHRVLLFALAAATLSGLVAGLVPVLRTLDWGGNPEGEVLGRELRDGGRGGSVGRRALLTGRLLVAAEVALALVLVLGAGLMIRSFVHLRQVDPGFSPQGVLAVQFTIPGARYPNRDQVLTFYDEFTRAMEARPGVQQAGIVSQLPLDGASWSSQFQAEGWPPDRVGFEILHRRADRAYFEALSTPLLRGRLFQANDGPDDPLVVVVNETFTREHFPGEDPIGVRIAYDRSADENSTWYEIVGIVGDQHQVHPGQPARAEVFENPRQDWSRTDWVVLRTDGDPLSLVPQVREVLGDLDPLVPLAAVRPLEGVWRTSLAREAFLLTLMGSFGLVALILAWVGVYGVTAEATRKRTQEIGIRMALGARSRGVVSLMVRRGMAVVTMGLVAGLGAFLLAGRALSSLLFGVTPSDPLTVAGVVALLLASAFLASWIPARRASAVDPVRALRSE